MALPEFSSFIFLAGLKSSLSIMDSAFVVGVKSMNKYNNIGLRYEIWHYT